MSDSTTSTRTAASLIPGQRFGEQLATPLGPSIGTLVLYAVAEKDEIPVAASREDLLQWFRDLGIDQQFLPPPARAVDAFRAATADVTETYERDGAQYTLTVEEIKGAARGQAIVVRNVMLSWSEQGKFKQKRVGHLQFTRPKVVGTARAKGTEKVAWFVDTRLAGLDQARVEAFMRNCLARYEAHKRSIEPHGLRAVLRAYFQHLNGAALVGARSTFMVPLGYDDPALTTMAEVMERAGCWMALVPLADLPGLRALVFRSVDLDIQRRAKLLMNTVDRFAEDSPVEPPSPMRRTTWILAYRELVDLMMHYADISGAVFPTAATALEQLHGMLAGLPEPTRPTHERVIKRWGGTWSDDQAVTL